MAGSIITAGDASTGTIINGPPGSDGTLILQSGPSGAKVSAIVMDVNGYVTNTKQSAARRTRATAQAIANNTTTIVTYDTAVFDQQTESDATGRFTAKASGIYHITASILYSNVAWPAGAVAYLSIFKNNISFCLGTYWVSQLAQSSNASVQVSSGVNLATGDFIDIRAAHTQGAAVNIQGDATFNYLSVHRVA